MSLVDFIYLMTLILLENTDIPCVCICVTYFLFFFFIIDRTHARARLLIEYV